MKLPFQLGRAFGGNGVRAALALFFAGVAAVSVLRGQTWTGASATSNNWSDTQNWNTGVPVSVGSITFGAEARTNNVFDLGLLQLATIIYPASSPAFTTTIGQNGDLTLSGVGINNVSAATTPTFIVSDGTSAASRAELSFISSASAGNANIINQGAATDGYGGITSFHDSSTAGYAILTNTQFGGSRAGTTVFDGHSTAAHATLIAYGAMPGSAEFLITGDASGGSAVVQMGSGGSLNISTLNGSGTTVGSIAGSGLYLLGTKTLTTGSLNTSTEVSGLISGGSLMKVGTGTLTLSGDVGLTGTTTVSGGALTISGTTSSGVATTVAAGATLNLASASEMNLGATGAGATPTSIAGTVNYSGSGNLVLGTTTQTTATGSFNAINAAVPDMVVTGGTFNNAGTFTKSGTGAVWLDGLAAFNNTATVNINAGALVVIDGTTFHNTGTTAVNGSGFLLIAAGSVLSNDSILNLAGTSSAQFALGGGVLANRLAGTVNWTGAAALQLGGGTVGNLGQFNAVSNDATVRQMMAGTFNNVATFTKTGTGEVQLAGLTSFNNSGTVNVNAGTLSTTQNYTNTNTGRTIVASGATMVFSGMNALMNSGVVTVNGTSSFNPGLYAFNSGSVIDGTGTVNLSNLSLGVTGTSILGVAHSNWTAGGVLNGTGTLQQTRAFNITGNMQIDAATFRNTGTTTVSGDSGFLAVTGGGAFLNEGTLVFAKASGSQLGFGGGTLANASGGIVNWTGAATVQVGGGMFANSGQFNAITNDVTAKRIDNGTFNNTGIFTKTGTGEVRLAGLTSFNNSGTVNVNAGTLSTDQNYTNTNIAHTTVASGATMVFSGMNALVNSGSVTVNGTGMFNGGLYAFNNGSVIDGAGTVNLSNLSLGVTGTSILGVAQSNWTSGGVINGTGVLLQTRAFDLTGNMQVDAATFHNTGTTTVSSAAGHLVVTGGGAFLNEGRLTLAGTSASQVTIVSATLVNAAGGRVNWTGSAGIAGPGALNNAGTFNKSGSGVQIIDATHVENTGNLNIQAGTLQLTNLATYDQLAGNLNISAGATLDVSGITGADFNGGAIRGNGTLLGDSSFNSGSLIAPGNSIGTLNFDGNTIWASGAGMQLELLSAGTTNVAGVANDFVNISGSLQLPASGFTLTLAGLHPGNAIDVLDSADSYNWTIATAAGGILGFSADAFSIVSIGVTNAAGAWSVFQSGNNLMLGFTGVLTPVPEPSTYAMISLAVCAAFTVWHRRRRKLTARPSVPPSHG